MRKFAIAIALALALAMFGGGQTPARAGTSSFSGSIFWISACLVTHAHVFIEYNVTGDEAFTYCSEL